MVSFISSVCIAHLYTSPLADFGHLEWILLLRFSDLYKRVRINTTHFWIFVCPGMCVCACMWCTLVFASTSLFTEKVQKAIEFHCESRRNGTVRLLLFGILKYKTFIKRLSDWQRRRCQIAVATIFWRRTRRTTLSISSRQTNIVYYMHIACLEYVCVRVRLCIGVAERRYNVTDFLFGASRALTLKLIIYFVPASFKYVWLSNEHSEGNW